MQSPDPFLLPVVYRETEHLLKAELSTWGYIHRINIEVEGQLIYFEPDEERNYRAVLADPSEKLKAEPGFVRAIIQALEKNFGS